MALVVADRVKETTTSTGTGAITLGGAPVNFVTFSSELSDGDTTYYAIVDNNNGDYEVGLGTYASSGNTITRTTILESSNSGSAVDLQAGTKDVFVTYPASKSVYLDASGEIANNQTFSGTVTLNADPTTGLQAATKQYVDDIAAAGIHYHDPVRVEKEGNLSATYDNGSAGVGATLTNNSTQEALVIDGVTLSVNDRVLIYEQTDATENGIYDVTDTGSASTNWVLTRSSDADSYSPSDPDSLGQGDGFFVQEGSVGAGETYVMNTVGTITFGTTDINFVQISSSQVYTGGTGISITGSQISSDITLDEVVANGATTSTAVTVGNLTSTGIDDNATSTAITIDSSDNVGIGKAPESWGNTWTALDVSYGGSLASYDSGDFPNTWLVSNGYNDNTDWRAMDTDQSCAIDLLATTGTIRFLNTTTATTAGDAFTWNETMSIDGSGIVSGLWSDNGTANSDSKFVKLTQAEYDALTPDSDTIYFIT